MKREHRYLVVKYKDMDCLTPLEKQILHSITSKVDNFRVRAGKTSLYGVFVEHDWPEYAIVWESIEARMDNKL